MGPWPGGWQSLCPHRCPMYGMAWTSPGLQISSSSPEGLARKEGPKATRAPEANSRAKG